MDKVNQSGTHESSDPRDYMSQGVPGATAKFGDGPPGAAQVGSVSDHTSPTGPSGLPGK